MDHKKEARKVQAETIIQNLQKRNMEGFYFDNSKDCVAGILSQIPENSTISWGGSVTFQETGMKEAVSNGHYNLIDRSLPVTDEEKRLCFSKIVLSDYFFMSTNAITLDGELINIDGNGNRLACLLQGPSQVIILAGMNKVVSSVEEGIKRVHNIASPPNTIRLNKKTPCALTGRCENCLSPDCICSHTVVTRHSGTKGRILVYLINEDLGF